MSETNETTVLLDKFDKDELQIGEQFKDEDGNLDVPQLFDDLELHNEAQDSDIRKLKGMLAELEARVVHEP